MSFFDDLVHWLIRSDVREPIAFLGVQILFFSAFVPMVLRTHPREPGDERDANRIRKLAKIAGVIFAAGATLFLVAALLPRNVDLGGIFIDFLMFAWLPLLTTSAAGLWSLGVADRIRDRELWRLAFFTTAAPIVLFAIAGVAAILSGMVHSR